MQRVLMQRALMELERERQAHERTRKAFNNFIQVSEHFTFDLPMPKLYAHFKKLKTEIAELAPAAGLTARVDALQRAVDQLVDVKLDEEIDALKTQLEKMDKRIAKLEKK